MKKFALLVLMAALVLPVSQSVHAEEVYLNFTGTDNYAIDIFGSGSVPYAATISYDSNQTPISTSSNSATYNVSVLDSSGPLSGTLTISNNATDPVSSSPADEFNFSWVDPGIFIFPPEPYNAYVYTDTSFDPSLTLPTVSQFQSEITSDIDSMSLGGGFVVPFFTGFLIGTDTISPLYLSANASPAPLPKSMFAGVTLFGLLGMTRLMRRRTPLMV